MESASTRVTGYHDLYVHEASTRDMNDFDKVHDGHDDGLRSLHSYIESGSRR